MSKYRGGPSLLILCTWLYGNDIVKIVQIVQSPCVIYSYSNH